MKRMIAAVLGMLSLAASALAGGQETTWAGTNMNSRSTSIATRPGVSLSTSGTGWDYNATVFASVSRTNTGTWVFTADKDYLLLNVQITVGGTKSATIIVSSTSTVTGSPLGGMGHGQTRLTVNQTGSYQLCGLGAWTKIRIDDSNGATVSIGCVYRQGACVDTSIENLVLGAGSSTIGKADQGAAGTTAWPVGVYSVTVTGGPMTRALLLDSTVMTDASGGNASGNTFSGLLPALIGYIANRVIVVTPAGVALSVSITGVGSITNTCYIQAQTTTITGNGWIDCRGAQSIIFTFIVSPKTDFAAYTGAGVTAFLDSSNEIASNLPNTNATPLWNNILNPNPLIVTNVAKTVVIDGPPASLRWRMAGTWPAPGPMVSVMYHIVFPGTGSPLNETGPTPPVHW